MTKPSQVVHRSSVVRTGNGLHYIHTNDEVKHTNDEERDYAEPGSA